MVRLRDNPFYGKIPFSPSLKIGRGVGGVTSRQWEKFVLCVQTREVVYMERLIEPNMGPSLADVLLCAFESTNVGFSSFPVRKLLS